MTDNNAVPEFVVSQSTVIDTENNTQNNTVNSSNNSSCNSRNISNEFSTKHNGERKNKEKKKTRNKERKKKTIESNSNNSSNANNNNNSNISNSHNDNGKNNNSNIIPMDNISLDYTSNNDSSVTMASDGSKTITTNATTRNNTWAAIDTLDDVRQLAKETTGSDNFDKKQENELNKMRQNQIKLLKLMIDRNSKLQKIENPFEESNTNGISTDNNNNNNNVDTKEPDKDVYHNIDLEESSVKPIKESTTKQKENVKPKDEKEYPQTSSPKMSNQESIYLSDYFETLDDVQLITRKESEYIEQMEKIINDSRIGKLLNTQNVP